MKLWVVQVCCLAGCAAPTSQSWVKPDAIDVDMRASMARCRMQASSQPLVPKLVHVPDENNPNMSGLSVWGMSIEDMEEFRRSVNKCMAAEGWTRR